MLLSRCLEFSHVGTFQCSVIVQLQGENVNVCRYSSRRHTSDRKQLAAFPHLSCTMHLCATFCSPGAHLHAAKFLQ